MTTIFSDDCETGDLSNFTSTFASGATIAASAAQAKNGTYSILTSGLGAEGEHAVAYKTLGAQTDTYVGAYIRLPTLPSGVVIMGLSLAHDTSQYYEHISVVYDFATSKWGFSEKVRTGSWQEIWQTGTTTFNADTWYWVEIHHLYHASDGAVALWVDGVEKASIAGVATDTCQTSVLWVGNGYSTGYSPDISIYVDDITVADEYIGLGEGIDVTYSSTPVEAKLTIGGDTSEELDSGESTNLAAGDYTFTVPGTV